MKYRFETSETSCPLCGEHRKKLIDRRNFRGVDVVNQLCRDCGLVYQSPRLSDESLNNFYRGAYRELYQGVDEVSPEVTVTQKKRALHLTDFINADVNPGSKVLDIGCSTGALLSTIQDKTGCDVLGIEPGDTYRAYAKEQGINVFTALEELEKTQTEPFDLIIMAHVLEHIVDPVTYLSDLKNKFLEPGGLLLIEVPNLYAHDCFELAHLVSFSRKTLENTLKKAGFSVIRTKVHGEPRSKILPLYIDVLAVPSSSNTGQDRISKEVGVYYKRKSALFLRKILQKLFPSLAWVSVIEE